MVAVMGFGLPLVDVNHATLTMRLAPDARLGRVFGAMEGTCIGTMAIGSAVTPFLLDEPGVRGVLSVLALLVGIPALAHVPRARRLDATLRPPPGTDLVAGIAMFAPLAPASVEFLARRLVPESAPAGTPIVTEGEPSDRFLVIVRGSVEVTQNGHHLRVEGPGDFFGEIGLLRDVPRTATVTALEDTDLVSLTREDFLGAATAPTRRWPRPTTSSPAAWDEAPEPPRRHRHNRAATPSRIPPGPPAATADPRGSA